jgi:hypothetical protein
MYGELMLILNLSKQMGDGLERLDVNNSISMGTTGVCLSSLIHLVFALPHLHPLVKLQISNVECFTKYMNS